MTDNTQPEALDLADWLEAVGDGLSTKRCAALLREQHARIAELEQEVAHIDGLLGKANALARVRAHHIAELEAQLEAIGAGGVSGPRIGRASLQSPGFDAADMATASAQGFRDGVASVAASAGSEPVATVFTMEALAPGGGVKYHATVHKPLPAGTKLYLHPSPPEGMVGGWQDIATAPKSSTDGRHIDGIYLLGFCPEPDACNLQSCICIVWWEPNMKGGNGMWYGEGGYEVHPTHWKPLPEAPTTSAGSGKGE